MGDSIFAPVRYNSCTIKVYFLFSYTSLTTNVNKVATNLNRVIFLGAGFSVLVK